MRGDIPGTELIILESNQDEWRLMTNGLIQELETTGIIEREPGKKIRIKLLIVKIFSPEEIFINNSNKIIGAGEVINTCLSKTTSFFNDYVGKERWVFLAYVNGIKQKPIFIIHYALVKIYLFTPKGRMKIAMVISRRL